MKSLQRGIPLILHGSLASFGAYFCMYAYRKPFTAARFEGLEVFNIDYKIALIIAQVLGYALSKFIGIKFISELQPNKRKFFFLLLIILAEISLLLFAIVPPPYNIIFMFLNGLPLGIIWGIVFSYLEGRKFTEILGVTLCTSFIVSSGVVKSTGLWLMKTLGLSEFWMPVATGALFLLPLVFFIFLLEKIPAPTAEDIALRTKRQPMTRAQRKAVFKTFAAPLSLLIFFYVMLSAFRDFRDNFARELWDSVGYTQNISVYSSSEMIIALVVLVLLGALFIIKNNIKALYIYHLVLFLGIISLCASTYLFQQGMLGAYSWMVLTGFGLYICYVPFNALFFDRFIAAFKINGNAGFLIYLADAFGYLGSVLVLLYKNFALPQLSWLKFFCYGAYFLSALGGIVVIFSYLHLKQKYKAQTNGNVQDIFIIKENATA